MKTFCFVFGAFYTFYSTFVSIRARELLSLIGSLSQREWRPGRADRIRSLQGTAQRKGFTSYIRHKLQNNYVQEQAV